jgi:hypothetical protein
MSGIGWSGLPRSACESGECCTILACRWPDRVSHAVQTMRALTRRSILDSSGADAANADLLPDRQQAARRGGRGFPGRLRQLLPGVRSAARRRGIGASAAGSGRGVTGGGAVVIEQIGEPGRTAAVVMTVMVSGCLRCPIVRAGNSGAVTRAAGGRSAKTLTERLQEVLRPR